MRRFQRWLLLAAAFVVVGVVTPAHSTDLTVKCTAPINGTDGKPLPSDETITFNLYGAMQGQPLKLLTPTPASACLWVRANVTPGTICYAPTAVGTRGTSTAESAQPTPVCSVVQPPATPPQPPGSPTVTAVTVATTVYMELQVPNGFSFLAIGTVPLGTPCDMTQGINNFNVVPTSAVTWTGNIHRLAALAACSVTK